MTKTVCKTKLGQNEWQTAIEVNRLHTYWGITEQNEQKEKKPEFTFIEKNYNI